MKRAPLLFLLILFCAAALEVRPQQKEEESFYVAEKAFSDRFYEASATLFEKFIRDFPQSTKKAQARLYVAQSLFHQKKYPEALAMLNSLREQEQARPFLDQVYYWLGQVYYEGKNYTQALEYALKVVDEFEGSPLFLWSKFLAGECYCSLSRFEECGASLRDVLEQGTEQDLVNKALTQLLNVYYSRERFAELVEFADRYYPRVEGETRARVLLYKGEGFFGLSDLARALKVLREGIGLTNDKELKNVFLQRIGDSLLRQGEEVKAKESFDQITSEDLRQFSHANYYLKIKDYETVLEIADEYLRNFPSSRYASHMMLNRADSLYEMGRINDALFSYKEILSSFPEDGYRTISDKAHYGLAWCYLKVGEFKKAIDEFKKTLKFTDNPVVRISSQIQIADAYQEKEMYDMALDIYNKILAEYPDNIYADYIQFQIGMLFLRNDKLDEAKMSFRNLAKNFPASKLVPQAEYYLAASYFSEGEYVSAQAVLEGFLEKFPRQSLRARVLYLYGKCYFNQGQYERALEILDKALAEGTDQEFRQLVSIDRAYAYLNLSRYEEAKAVFSDFVNNFPRSEYLSSVLLKLGGLYEREDNFSEAERYYSLVVESYPQHSVCCEALNALAHLYWEQDKLDEARTYFEKIVSLGNQKASAHARLYLAEIMAQQGSNKEALAIFDSLAADPSLAPLALARKGMLLKDLRDYEPAADALSRALDLGLDDTQVHFSLGLCLEKLGRDSEALNEYLKIVYLFDDVADKVKAYLRTARIYEKNNKISEAIQMYRKISEFGVEESKVARDRIDELNSMPEVKK